MNAELTLRVAALLVGSALATTGAWAEDLLGIYRTAANSDTTLRGARFALAAADERVPQAQAGLLPSVSLNGSSTRQAGAAAFANAQPVEREVRGWNWSVQATQPLWRPGAVLAYTQAQAQNSQAVAQFLQVQQDLMLRAAQAYLDILVARESMRVAQSQRDAVGQQLQLANRNLEVGTGTVTDVHEAQARLDLSRAQWVVARSEHDMRVAEIERLLGAPVPSLAALSPDAALPPLPVEPLDEWLTLARAQHPTVRIQQAGLEAAEHEINRQQAGHFPTLDLTVSRGRNYASGSLGSPADISSRAQSMQVGLTFTMPLYAGGATQSRLREAFAMRDKAGEDLEGARRLASTQARQAYAALLNGHAQVQALLSAVRSSQSAVDSNRIGFRVGTRINIDVLNAEQQLHAAQRDLYKARADVLLSGLKLKAAAGNLEEGDLAALRPFLNEDAP